MMLLPILLLSAQTPAAPTPQVKQTDPLRVPVPPDKPRGFREVEAPIDRAGDPIPTGKPKTMWTFRRNNPRSTFILQTGVKKGGRPALVDAAGKPVRQNSVFTVKHPVLGPIKVYATKLARGPFFTPWVALPKNSAGKYLQVSGTLMTPTEIRMLVGGIQLLKTSRAPQKTVGGDPYERDAGEDKTSDDSTVNGGGSTGGGSTGGSTGGGR